MQPALPILLYMYFFACNSPVPKQPVQRVQRESRRAKVVDKRSRESLRWPLQLKAIARILRRAGTRPPLFLWSLPCPYAQDYCALRQGLTQQGSALAYACSCLCPRVLHRRRELISSLSSPSASSEEQALLRYSSKHRFVTKSTTCWARRVLLCPGLVDGTGDGCARLVDRLGRQLLPVNDDRLGRKQDVYHTCQFSFVNDTAVSGLRARRTEETYAPTLSRSRSPIDGRFPAGRRHHPACKVCENRPARRAGRPGEKHELPLGDCAEVK